MKTRETAQPGDIYKHIDLPHMTVLRVLGWCVSAQIVEMSKEAHVITFWDNTTDRMRANLSITGGSYVARAAAIKMLELLGSVDGVIVRYESRS